MWKNEPVLRYVIDPIPITLRHCVKFSARKFTKKCAKYESVSRFLIDPMPITLRHCVNISV